jgi:hypothetical protein
MNTTQKTTTGREFTTQRRAQGFRSQAHLDAWYRAYGHTQACPAGICGTPGLAVPLDDGMQPTVRQCEEAVRLFDEASRIWRES